MPLVPGRVSLRECDFAQDGRAHQFKDAVTESCLSREGRRPDSVRLRSVSKSWAKCVAVDTLTPAEFRSHPHSRWHRGKEQGSRCCNADGCKGRSAAFFSTRLAGRSLGHPQPICLPFLSDGRLRHPNFEHNFDLLDLIFAVKSGLEIVSVCRDPAASYRRILGFGLAIFPSRLSSC